MKHSTKRTKVLPNTWFCRLWEQAVFYDDPQDYYRAFSSFTSKDYLNWSQIRIDERESFLLLREIYKWTHMSVAEIIDATGRTKSALATIFCIPKRTIENWYYGKRECAPYFRLMFIRQFHLLNLGKYIVLESDLEYQQTIPGIYEKHEVVEEDERVTEEGNLYPEHALYSEEQLECTREELRRLLFKERSFTGNGNEWV